MSSGICLRGSARIIMIGLVVGTEGAVKWLVLLVVGVVGLVGMGRVL